LQASALHSFHFDPYNYPVPANKRYRGKLAGFWLPTSTTKFYPDFVCELVDGRLFVVEYKGEHLRNVAKEIEKDQVGKVWAERSAGQCLFAMVFKLERGLTVAQQLDAVLHAKPVE